MFLFAIFAFLKIDTATPTDMILWLTMQQTVFANQALHGHIHACIHCGIPLCSVHCLLIILLVSIGPVTIFFSTCTTGRYLGNSATQSVNIRLYSSVLAHQELPVILQNYTTTSCKHAKITSTAHHGWLACICVSPANVRCSGSMPWWIAGSMDSSVHNLSCWRNTSEVLNHCSW